jgi:hypothetical protein
MTRTSSLEPPHQLLWQVHIELAIHWMHLRSSDFIVLQADLPHLLEICALIDLVLVGSPDCISTSLEANLIPGLVRVVRKLNEECHSAAAEADLLDIEEKIWTPIYCIHLLLKSSDTCLKPAIDASLVPAIIELITLSAFHEGTIIDIVILSGCLLLGPTPEAAEPWAGRLLCAVAGLICATPPVASCAAANLLLNIGLLRPDQLADFRSWGLVDSLGRLTLHNDPDTAAAAKRLEFVVSRLAETDVSITFPRTSLIHMCFPSVLPLVWAYCSC